MKKTTIMLSLVFLTIMAKGQTIDTDKSEVIFEISSMGFTTVDGKIVGMTGAVNYNDANPKASSFNVCIDPNTVDTDNEERDEHLKNPDFFDVNKYPTICFVSKSITLSGTKEYKYIATGAVTIYDTTKDEKIIFSKVGNKFVGKLKIDRFDYNLGIVEYDGTFMVGNEVDIEIVCILK